MPALQSKHEDSPVSGAAVIEQIDGLEGASAARRDRALGQGWVESTRQFYNIDRPSRLVPSFRPQVSVPLLQVINLSEASDLTETDPAIYLSYQDKRREPEEKYLQKIWRSGAFNIENMMALIWAMSVGTGVTMVGYDSQAASGRGAPWVECIPLEDFYPDPDARDEDKAQYMIYRTYSSKSQLVERYGPRAEAVRERDTGGGSSVRPLIRVGGGGPMLSVPERSPGNFSRDIGFRTGFGGQLLPVRTATIEDFSVERDKETRRWIRKYPGKRRIVDAGGVTLYDDRDTAPWGMFPFVRFLAIPPLEGFWGVDPTRFSLPLQELAEKFYTQTYENAYRTNNATVVIDKGSGLTKQNYRGMPGEVVVVNPGREAPKHIWPSPMPAHMVELPDKLLQLAQVLQSRVGGRTGESGKGNISVDLFDASVYQSQPITRMRSKLMARSLLREAKLVVGYMLSRFAGGRNIAQSSEDGPGWNVEGTDPNLWEINVDPDSVFPYSGSALRKSVPALRQMGLIDVKRALELLKIPHADEIAEEIQREEELGALAGIKRTRR